MIQKRDGVIACASAIIVVVCGWMLGADSPPTSHAPKVIRAERFEIVNEKGDVVAGLEALGEGWPGIALNFGSNPHGVAAIMPLPDGSIYAQLYDTRDDKTSAVLRLSFTPESSIVTIGKRHSKASATLGLRSAIPPLTGVQPFIELIGVDGKRIPESP